MNSKWGSIEMFRKLWTLSKIYMLQTFPFWWQKPIILSVIVDSGYLKKITWFMPLLMKSEIILKFDAQ